METDGKSSLFWIFLMLQTIKTDTWHCLCQNRVQIWNRWGQKHIKRAITHDPTTFGYEVMTKYNIGWRPYWILRLWRPQWPPALALSKNEFSMVWSTCVPNVMLVDKSAQYHPKWSLSSSTKTESEHNTHISNDLAINWCSPISGWSNHTQWAV